MRPAEREAAIRAVALYLASKSESEADHILRSAGTDLTPIGWEQTPIPKKRAAVRQILEEEPDEVVEFLTEFMLPDKAPQVVAQSRSPAAVEVMRTADGPIFVVHGHARAVLHEAVRVLERGTGREVIVLHEQANAGRTILEKFEDHAGGASFAVVLLTGDDQGSVRTAANMNLRGRQNVIFELGFFFGKLGRRRVAVLLEENVEKPSDIEGLVYITYDPAGAWKQTLARELEAAGISVDRARIP